MHEENYDLANQLKFEVEVAEKVEKEEQDLVLTRQHVFRAVLYQRALSVEILLKVSEYIPLETKPMLLLKSVLNFHNMF